MESKLKFRRFFIRKRKWSVRIIYETHRPEGILQSRASGIVTAKDRDDALERFLEYGNIARHAVCRFDARPVK